MSTLVRIAVVLSLFGATRAQGQTQMMLFGIVEDQRTEHALQNVCVRVYTDSIPGDSIFTDIEGRYQLFVPMKGCHRVVYSSEGFYRKAVEVDTNGKMDPVDRQQEWNLRIDITLLTAEKELPELLLDTPVGSAAWIPATKSFEWDQAYTARSAQRFKEALKQAKRK